MVHHLGRDPVQKLNVIGRMELRKLLRVRLVGPVNLQLLVQSISQDQTVRHAEAMRLHGVVGTIVYAADVGIEKVGHTILAGGHAEGVA